MIGGNLVKKHYDKLCEKFNGNCVVLHDVYKGLDGTYRDEYVYEIVKVIWMLYAAFIDEDESIFSILEIEVFNIDGREYPAKEYCFTIPSYISVRCINEPLNRTIEIGTKRYVMFSYNKNKLIEWLNRKRNILIDKHLD